MANTTSLLTKQTLHTDREALAIAAQAKVLSGNKLEMLVVRLQRHSGQPKTECWRFLIQYGLKSGIDHRRWSNEEFEALREGLAKFSVEEMAAKLHRSPKALRQKLAREGFNLREIRCDLLSVDTLSSVLHVQRSKVLSWIELGWLPAVKTERNRRNHYSITPEALTHLYRNHLQDVLKRGIPNQTLFEAYIQYCHSPKHTVGEQLLNVRRDKRERAAYEQACQSENLESHARVDDVDSDENAEPEDRYRVAF